MHKLKRVLKIFGLFLLVFIVGVTVLFAYQLKLEANSQPLTYFEEVSFKNLYEIVSRKKVLGGSDKVMAKLTVSPKYSKLDGKIIEDSDEVIVAMMMDNHVDARPQQSGLSKAGVVYEALAEGGITRYMAVFSNQDIEKYGPVRSARPYFVRFAAEYNGGYGHAGGSPPALSLIPTTGMVNLEGLYYEEISSDYFYRDMDYYAPHNLFANIKNVTELMQSKKDDCCLKESRFIFGELKNPEDYPSAENIEVNFSNYYFNVRYKFNSERNVYYRYLAGKKHIDSLFNVQIAPRNILIQITSYYVYDDKGRLKMEVEGSNKAFVFTQGRVVEGYWKKTGNNFTRFYNNKDEEIPLLPGLTWISIIKSEEMVSWGDSK